MTELLVGMFATMVILTAIVGMVRVATNNQDRVAERVAANQKLRPVMTRILDTLHSACIAPEIAPVQAGSTGTSISVLSKTGSAVAPTPDRNVYTLTGSTLTHQVFPASGGTIPNWTFSTTPTTNRTLLTGVSQGRVGTPPTAVPPFRYYSYNGDTINSTPLATPLSATDAARTAYISVTLAAAPAGNVTGPEQLNRMTISDSTSLRLEAPSDATGTVNRPCA